MQVTETVSEGLKRELKIVVDASELDQRLTARLEELKNQVQLKGFRPGKVPLGHMRRTFGKRVMPEVVEAMVQETTQKALTDREERPALQPKISFGEESDALERIMGGSDDLAFTMAFEVMPEITATEFSAISVTKPVAEVTDDIIDEAIDSLRKQQRQFESRDDGAKAEDGDRVTIDFVGRVDGEEFEGGKGEDAQLELGSASFIPGFEEQLAGSKVDDVVEVKVTFPEDYGMATLAGKDAEFTVTVKDVAAPQELEVDDDFAKALGMEDVPALREAIKSQIASEYAGASRTKVKRQLLDALDSAHSFALPEGMVDNEFDSIWDTVKRDMEKNGQSFEDDDADEDAARAEYRTIAERRVRLGLVLADVGEKNGIQVTDDEVNRELMERVRQFPGHEEDVLNYYRSNPQAMAELRSPVFEEKVVDFVLELATVEEKPVTREELMAEDVDESSKDAAADDAKKPAKKKTKSAAKPKPKAKAKKAETKE